MPPKSKRFFKVVSLHELFIGADVVAGEGEAGGIFVHSFLYGESIRHVSGGGDTPAWVF